MKKIATLAIAAIAFAAAGCASTNGAGNVAAAPTSGVAYCAADRLFQAADALTCNWAKTVKEACESRTSTALPKSQVAEGPTKGGMCQGGDRLVYVTMK